LNVKANGEIISTSASPCDEMVFALRQTPRLPQIVAILLTCGRADVAQQALSIGSHAARRSLPAHRDIQSAISLTASSRSVGSMHL
jgi:hypothetical protein